MKSHVIISIKGRMSRPGGLVAEETLVEVDPLKDGPVHLHDVG